MPPSATQPPDATESLISAEAAKASAQALARLARAGAADERRQLPGGGLPVEQFLQDLMTPLLRDWLDRHLPEIVERVVEQEVKKLARRAELL
jgi:cell pole-organizing protein PopZ